MLSVLTTIKEKDTWERPLSSLYPSSAPSSESVCFFTRLLSHFPLKFKITKYFLYPRKIVFLFIGRLINVKHLKAFKVIHQDFILGDNACYLLMYLIIYVYVYMCLYMFMCKWNDWKQWYKWKKEGIRSILLLQGTCNIFEAVWCCCCC